MRDLRHKNVSKPKQILFCKSLNARADEHLALKFLDQKVVDQKSNILAGR